MGKYDSSYSRDSKKPKREVHPIWRGVGCSLLILIPIISYSGARVLLEQNAKSGWFPIPGDLIARGTFPLVGNYPMLYIEAILTVALMLVLYGLFTLIYFMFYSMFAPPRYSDTDAPPIRARNVKKSR